MREARERNFKLGCFHGRDPHPGLEQEIRNKVFKHGFIKIKHLRSHGKETLIRIVAYEMPLGHYRDECIDLVGYDKQHSLYLIEIKKAKSPDNLYAVNCEISRYASGIVVKNIEKAFREELFFPIAIKKVKKVILAPSEFYPDKGNIDREVQYLYFKDKDILKRKTWGPIIVHEWQFKK